MRLRTNNTLHSYIHSGVFQTLNRTKRNKRSKKSKSKSRRRRRFKNY